MAAITIDISAFPKAIRESLASQCEARDKVKRTLALANQKRLAALQEQAAGRYGVLDAVFDPYWVSYFSRVCDAREMVWDDPEFVPWLKKQDPMFAGVRHRPSKPSVLVA